MSLFRLTWALGYKIMMRHTTWTKGDCYSLVFKATPDSEAAVLLRKGRCCHNVSIRKGVFMYFLFVLVLVVLLVTSDLIGYF